MLTAYEHIQAGSWLQIVEVAIISVRMSVIEEGRAASKSPH